MTEFSIEQEHFLKRELLKREINQEVAKLDDFRNISIFGPPFDSHGAPAPDGGYEEFPLLRHMFDRYVVTFPFLQDVDKDHFWKDRVQPFIESFADKDISDSADRSEDTKRKKTGRKIHRLLLIYASSGFQTTRVAEKDVEVETERMMKKGGIQEIDARTLIQEATQGHYVNGYDINVEGVRMVTGKRTLFTENKSWQYIIRSQIKGAPELRVGRTYAEFRDFDTRLRSEFPGKKLPRLPIKHKSPMKFKTPEEIMQFVGEKESRPSGETQQSNNENENNDEDDDDADPDPDPEDEISSNQVKRLNIFRGLGKKKGMPNKIKVAREKQRITLRAYLRGLLDNRQVAQNALFLEFLFKDRITKLTEEELNDIAIRKKLDLIRVEDQLKFLEIAKERARKLEVYVNDFKKDMKEGGQFLKLFEEFKSANSISELSPRMQHFIEWAMVEFSATLYQLLVGGDNSPELYSQIRRVHSMMPYTILRGILKYSNPMAIMKGVSDLFLAVPPFSKRSLLQSIFMMVLSDDIKEQEKLIKQLKEKVPSDMAEVIHRYVYSPYEIRKAVQKYADQNKTDLVASIFEAGDYGDIPRENQKVMQSQVQDWYKAWNELVDNPEATVDVVKVNEYSQLKEMLQITTRKRDKDQMQQFWADTSTMNLIREVVSIFYTPLVKLFKVANMSQAVGDFEKFMDDLIKVVDRSEGLSGAAMDPNQLVEEFIQLCHRHQNSIFRFIHDVYKNDKDKLFERLIRWISTIMDVLRQGTGKQLNMMQLITTKDVDTAGVLQELDSIISWAAERKRIRVELMGNETYPGVGSGTSLAWDAAIPKGGLDISDFGLTQEIDSDGEAEQDDEAEAIIAQEDGGDDHVAQEREFRRKLATRKILQEQLPPFPELQEIPKLESSFHALLKGVLI